MKNSYLTFTDQFCGAGGSSQGVRNAAQKYKGIELKLALNHWQLAIETHNTNFPDTMHDCTDISASDPRRYPSTDILITSPECTVHSPAGGNHYKALKHQMSLFEKGIIDPSAQRSRATMWDVCRFAEYHQYEAIIVENVVEAKTRWPLFDVWLKAMHTLGYLHKCCYLNSMHCHPTPQSRDRMYVVFWKKGNKAPDLEFTPDAFCQACDQNVKSFQWWKNPQKKFGKYRQQYLYRCPICTSVVEPYYYAAFNIIDWSIPGKSVLGRKKPLSPNTIRRIEYGLEKYGHEYLIIGHRYSEDLRINVKEQSEPLPSQTSSNLHGLVTPYIINTCYGGAQRKVSESFPTQTGQGSHGLVVPFLINTDNSNGKDAVAIKSTMEASRTMTTSHGMGVVMPIIVENNGQSKAKSATNPVPCVTTEMKHGIINPESFGAFLSCYYGGSNVASSLTESTRTISTRDRMAMVRYQKPKLEDCSYRTIRPDEVKAAMAFDHDYVVLGNGKEQVKQCGNAVTPPAMEWLSTRVVESLL